MASQVQELIIHCVERYVHNKNKKIKKTFTRSSLCKSCNRVSSLWTVHSRSGRTERSA